MNIKLTDILTYSGLKDAKVVAGINGLNRQIKYISVYDCIQPEDFDVDESGVLYITTFGQFKDNDKSIMPWLEYLNQHKVSGLCTIDDAATNLSLEVINFCNDNAFPIISVDTNLPYAEIIDSVSSLLHFNNLHVINEKRVENILYNKLSDFEIMDELRSINQHLKNQIAVISIDGNLESNIFVKRMGSIFGEHKEHSYLQFHDTHLFILSSNDDKSLDKTLATSVELVKPFYINPVIGVSKKFELIDFRKALINSQRALNMARIYNRTYFVYDDFSDVALLYPIRDSEEMKIFYKKFQQLLAEDDDNGKMKLTECVKAFVRLKGDWSEVSRQLYQSENTIRYRLNKIKSALGLENDIIKFHELISLFVTIDDIYKTNNPKR